MTAYYNFQGKKDKKKENIQKEWIGKKGNSVSRGKPTSKRKGPNM